MRRPPLDLDISVSKQRKKAGRARSMSGAFEGSQRGCAWPDCKARGCYRAPKAPDRLSEFHWFCLDHVRLYNSKWNYYAGMSPEEIDTRQREDTTWARPTWRLDGQPKTWVNAHGHGDGLAWKRAGVDDPLEVLGERATINPGGKDPLRAAQRRLLSKADLKALRTLGLEDTATREEAHTRYKALIKALHPDLNGGDRSEEGRFREVLSAWTQLKGSTRFR